MSLISSAGNNFANVATSNFSYSNNVSFQSNPQNNTQVRNPDAPQAVPQKSNTATKKQNGNISGGFGSFKPVAVGNASSAGNIATDNLANQKVDKQALQEALDKIQKQLLLSSNRSLKFTIDNDANNRLLVKILDKTDDTLIVQIPSETAIRLSDSFEEFQKFQEGLILSEKI